MNARLPRSVIVAGRLQHRPGADEQLLRDERPAAWSRSTPATISPPGTPRLTGYCDVQPPFQTNVKALAVLPAAVGPADERHLSGPAGTADPGQRRDPQRRHRAVARPEPVGVSGDRRLQRHRVGQPDPAGDACTASGCNQVDFRVAKAFTLRAGPSCPGDGRPLQSAERRGGHHPEQHLRIGVAAADADPAGAAGEVRCPARLLSRAFRARPFENSCTSCPPEADLPRSG